MTTLSRVLFLYFSSYAIILYYTLYEFFSYNSQGVNEVLREISTACTAEVVSNLDYVMIQNLAGETISVMKLNERERLTLDKFGN